MAHSTSTRINDDGMEIFEQYWQPEGKPEAVICLIHGLGEHSSRYQHLADFYNRKGYLVASYDLRGHGRSKGQRGHYPSLEAAMDDIRIVTEKVENSYPEVPVFLYGHSLGGVMVLNYVMRYKNHITAVIATSPGLATGQKVAPWKLTLGKLLYSTVPTFSMPNGLDVENISRDKEVVRKYISDPLVHNKITARFGLDFINAGAWALDHAAEFPLPLLLQYGSGDHIVSGDAIRTFARRAPNVTYREWDGCFHELHNEPEKEEFFDFSEQWIQTQLTGVPQNNNNSNN
jgi:alpha-beta hydrolase superfamily lysophospholipase